MRIYATVLMLAIGLTGCVQAQPGEVTPTPTRAPVFASDEEALAAAEEAYAAYLAMSDLMLSKGGASPERLELVATGEFLESGFSSAAGFRAKGLHSIGASAIKTISLQTHEPGGVSVYLCDDVSQVDVVDSEGTTVVSAERPDYTLFQVEFSLSSDKTLLISNRQVWGDGLC